MFHLCGGIAFCVDVGDFLQFKRTLQRNGIIVAASQIEEVVRVGENFREVSYLCVVFQNLGNLVGDVLQMSCSSWTRAARRSSETVPSCSARLSASRKSVVT